MKAKQLILLVIAGVVLGGIAWWTSRDDSGESSLVGTKLLAGVDLNSIDEIIVSAGSDTCRMVRDEKGWVVPSRYGYAANFSKIRNLLIKLDGLEIGQIAEVREDQKSELGVTAAAGTNIKLYAGGNELAALLLGDQRERQSTSPGPRSFGGFPDGRYISADGGTTVCLVGDPIREVTTQIEEWLNTELLNVSGGDVARVRVAPAEGDAYEIVRDDDDKLTMAGLAEGEEYDTSKTYTIEGALSHLNLKDVADPKLTDADLGFDKASTFQAWTKDGKQFDVTVSDPIGDTDDRYARISVQYVEPEVADEEEEGDESTEEDTPDAGKAEQTKTEVAKLNSRLGKWTFRIQGYKAGAFYKPRSELLKEPEEEQEEEPEAEVASPETTGSSEPDAEAEAAESASSPAAESHIETAPQEETEEETPATPDTGETEAVTSTATETTAEPEAAKETITE